MVGLQWHEDKGENGNPVVVAEGLDGVNAGEDG